MNATSPARPRPLNDTAQVLQFYQRRASELYQQARRDDRLWGMLSYARGSLFLLSVGLLLCGLIAVAGIKVPWFVLAAIVFLLFLVVAYIHENIDRRRETTRIHWQFARQSISRCGRRWAQLPVTESAVPATRQAVADDLDLFGSASLFQLIGTVNTPFAQSMLRDWMIDDYPPAVILDRQQAIAELIPQHELRERLQWHTQWLSGGQSGPAEFLQWIEGATWLQPRAWLLWVARVLALAMIALWTGLVTGWIALPTAGPALMALMGVNFFFTVFVAGRIHSIFNQVSSRHGDIRHYRAVFELISAAPAAANLLKDLAGQVARGECNAVAATDSLGLRVWLANLRRHGILFIVYLGLQFLFLWDVHVLSLLEKWQLRHRQHVRQWFQCLAQWEVLSALAKLAFDHPHWAFAQFREPAQSAPPLVARQLGHPLLANETRVSNDVQIGPPGTVLLVTGSNMSGKSTLLRALGTNVVLAQMGSTVCASQMSLVPLHLETSMRIRDSLAEGVSYYMAELQRLKEVVDIADQFSRREDRRLLYLLDEVLQGTNSRERHIAVSRVIRHLIQSQAVGAVSTHDLDLAHADGLAGKCQPVHFQETFVEQNGKREMSFDYRMRPGVATTTNALELLRLVGLDDPPE